MSIIICMVICGMCAIVGSLFTRNAFRKEAVRSGAAVWRDMNVNKPGRKKFVFLRNSNNVAEKEFDHIVSMVESAEKIGNFRSIAGNVRSSRQWWHGNFHVKELE